MREKYDPVDNKWTSHPRFDAETFLNSVENTLGTSVPLGIEPNGDIVVDFDELPDGVSENDVKQAVRDNHPYR